MLHDADYTPPTRQHELDHTKLGNIYASKYLGNEVGTDMYDLYDMFEVSRENATPPAWD